MKKKLQVFISSTFNDMVEERKTAVKAILNAGHIPIGMEQFNPGDEPQKELISRWMNEADVYLLMLGGRYGSIDEETGDSFTHWEYKYAEEIGLSRFALVMEEEAIEKKAQLMGTWVSERKNYAKYEEFRLQVLGKISALFNDTKDIEIFVGRTLTELEKKPELTGWILAKDLPNVTDLEREITELRTKNEQLKAMLKNAQQNAVQQPSSHLRIKGDYLEFLIHLFKATKGRQNTMISMWDLGKYASIDRERTSQVAEYLKQEGLLKYMAAGGMISITHQGVVLIEDFKGDYPPLNEVEKTVLEFLHDRDTKLTGETSPNLNSLLSDGKPELAFYLSRLEENGLIKTNGDAFGYGGILNTKYRNNVAIIWFEKIKITNKGIITLKFL
jgi:hypothetical protein